MTRHLGGLLNFIAGDLGFYFLYKYFCNFDFLSPSSRSRRFLADFMVSIRKIIVGS